jgi:hypothetical protein
MTPSINKDGNEIEREQEEREREREKKKREREREIKYLRRGVFGWMPTAGSSASTAQLLHTPLSSSPSLSLPPQQFAFRTLGRNETTFLIQI